MKNAIQKIDFSDLIIFAGLIVILSTTLIGLINF